MRFAATDGYNEKVDTFRKRTAIFQTEKISILFVKGRNIVMNAKERITAVFNGRIPDRTPYFDFIMSQRFVREMIGSAWPINANLGHRISCMRDLDGYTFPVPQDDCARDIEKAVALADGKLAVFAGIQGPQRTAWFLMGYENISYSLYDEPEFLHRVFRGAVDYFKMQTRRVCRPAGRWLICPTS